jgi:two-component system response regulator DctR
MQMERLMMSQARPTVFIVDDDEAVRKGLRTLMETVNLGVETFDSAQAFLDAYDPSQAGCLLLDVRMPGMSGLWLRDKLVEKDIKIPIIFITGHGDLPMAVEAVKKGAFDFLEKPVGDQRLLDTVQAALAKDAELRQQLAAQEVVAARLALLTPRERQVLELVSAGKLNKVIASELGVSESTVERHRAGVMEKMQVDSVAELVTFVNNAGTRSNLD